METAKPPASVQIRCKYCHKQMCKENIKRHIKRVHEEVIRERTKKDGPNAIFKTRKGEDYEDVTSSLSGSNESRKLKKG